MKSLLSVALIIGATLSLSAQKFYLSPSLGYGFGLRGDAIPTESGNSLESKGIDLGGGGNVGLAGGMFFTEEFALELRLNYQNNLGTSYNILFDFSLPNSSAENSTFNAQSIRIASMLHYRASQKLAPYLKLGPLLQWSDLRTTDEGRNFNNEPTISETEFSFALALGIAGEMGLSLQLNEQSALTAGFSFALVEAGLSSDELVRDEVNGQDQLANRTTAERETEYVKSVSFQGQASRTQNEPSLRPRQWLSYSNITFRLGYQVRL